MPYYPHQEDDLDSAEAAGFAPEDVPRAVAAFGGDIDTKGMELPIHEHQKAQLVLTLRGVVRCEADQSVWIVPPRSAVWIPGSLPHSMTLAGMVSVLLDQLSLAPVEKLNFPMPHEARLRTIAEAMMADPSDRATIEDWGRRSAVAPRTLTRALKRETGMSFGRWRQQLHILIALERLDRGASVHTVALELGYEDASAFVTMFRKAMGKPPARYLAERRTRLDVALEYPKRAMTGNSKKLSPLRNAGIDSIV